MGLSRFSPWELKLQRFPAELAQPFSADVMFSCEGKAFWTDLSQGVACSDLHAATGSAVDTVFIDMPDEFQIDYPDSPEPLHRPSKPATKAKMTKVTRTGAAEGSVCWDKWQHQYTN